MTLAEVDPNTVVPGWWPLILVIVLGLIMVFLFRSMMKQMRRIDVPRDGDAAAPVEPREHSEP